MKQKKLALLYDNILDQLDQLLGSDKSKMKELFRDLGNLFHKLNDENNPSLNKDSLHLLIHIKRLLVLEPLSEISINEITSIIDLLRNKKGVYDYFVGLPDDFSREKIFKIENRLEDLDPFFPESKSLKIPRVICSGCAASYLKKEDNPIFFCVRCGEDLLVK